MGPEEPRICGILRLYLELAPRVRSLVYLDPGIYGFVRCKPTTGCSRLLVNRMWRGVDNGADNNSSKRSRLLMIINDVTPELCSIY